MLQQWFATPGLLFASLAAPLAAALMVFAYVRRRQLTARLASPILLRRSVHVRPRVRRWKAYCLLLGLTLTAIAAAGPQWGLDRNSQIRKGRDVVIVLDLSRSMSAEQPSRRELALRALRRLADSFETHGGNRVGLIVFASQARLLFPLTHDLDHLRHVLRQIENDDINNLAMPNPISGTRIGAALTLAAESCDPHAAGRPVVILLSDGDDPADDNEHLEGIKVAKDQGLRVHVVGVGDPQAAETIPDGEDVLQFEGQAVRTKMNESRLKEIADKTDGVYLAAHRESQFPLGTFVLHLLDADELHEGPAARNALPTYQLRYAWFLVPALVFFALAMIIRENLPMRDGLKSRAMHRHPSASLSRPSAMALVLLAILTISAADPPEADALMRLGADAFARQQYDQAVKYFEQAERLTHDPGLVSFNKAAAYFRLKQYRDAIDSYRRCLEDDRIPTERRARARFDLGNALVQYAGDQPEPLAEAVAAYRACLLESDLSPQLRADARHNLEIAQARWVRAIVNQPESKDPPPKPKDKQDPDDGKKDPKSGDPRYVPIDPLDGKQQAEGKTDLNSGQKAKKLQTGSIQHLADTEKIQPLSPDETLALLDAYAERIARARRAQRAAPRQLPLSTKDW